MKSKKCLNCGAPIKYREGKQPLTCEFCGERVSFLNENNFDVNVFKKELISLNTAKLKIILSNPINIIWLLLFVFISSSLMQNFRKVIKVNSFKEAIDLCDRDIISIANRENIWPGSMAKPIKRGQRINMLDCIANSDSGSITLQRTPVIICKKGDSWVEYGCDGVYGFSYLSIKEFQLGFTIRYYPSHRRCYSHSGKCIEFKPIGKVKYLRYFRF
tara:strand:- start:34 stop:681 length:648 start_codon:yes stop_codon:yes gene_type:complete